MIRPNNLNSKFLERPAVQWAAAAAAIYGGYRLVQRLREASLDGQVALITGGSRGLGYLLAQEFARAGCSVAICGRDPATLKRARQDLQERGAEVIALQCDLADAHAVHDLVTAVDAHYGRIDILVNNAGVIQVGPVESVSEDDVRHALDVMFWAPLRAIFAVLPQMRRRRHGRIVNIASIGGMVSVPHLLPYNCAKFAAMGLSQGLRTELGRYGIHVTTIVPGLMRAGSHYHADFRGNAQREYEWFALGATLPGLSMSVHRAARQIVRATRRGEALRILGAPARIFERLHGLMPGTTTNVLACINRLLPDMLKASTNGGKRGWEIESAHAGRLFRAVTSFGASAADTTNQFPGIQGDGAGGRRIQEPE
jgi:NAD(P)-dependent dehydrogenase (short-subunit alcohol dehydrogenase family)